MRMSVICKMQHLALELICGSLQGCDIGALGKGASAIVGSQGVDAHDGPSDRVLGKIDDIVLLSKA
jgi:hypothetical protein